MKRALNELMLYGPSWILRRHVDEHPSNGLDEVLRVLKKKLSTSLTDFHSGKIICEDVVYTKIRLTAKEEKYGSSSVTFKEYIVIEFTSSRGQGFLEIPEHASVMSMRCVFQDKYVIKEDEYHVRYSDQIEVPGREMFNIIQDHREYPIWTTRCATLTFLLCGRSLPFPRDISKIIAKKVWMSRHDRKTWWPDITDDWDRDEY